MTEKRSVQKLIDTGLSGLKLKDGFLDVALCGQTKTPGKSRFRWQTGVLAACCVLLLAITAVAASLGYFDRYFGSSDEAKKHNVAEINKTVENNGYIFTILEAYTGDYLAQVGDDTGFTGTKCYLSMTVQKSDGSAFEPKDDLGVGERIDYFFEGPLPPNYEQWKSDGDIVNMSKNTGLQSNYYFEDGQVSQDYKKWKAEMDEWSKNGGVYSFGTGTLSEDKKTINVLLSIGGYNLEAKDVKFSIEKFSEFDSDSNPIDHTGPWEFEVTVPKKDEIQQVYPLNFTADIDGKEVVFDKMVVTPTKIAIRCKGDPSVSDHIQINLYTKDYEREGRFEYVKESDGFMEFACKQGFEQKTVDVQNIQYIIVNGQFYDFIG